MDNFQCPKNPHLYQLIKSTVIRAPTIHHYRHHHHHENTINLHRNHSECPIDWTTYLRLIPLSASSRSIRVLIQIPITLGPELLLFITISYLTNHCAPSESAWVNLRNEIERLHKMKVKASAVKWWPKVAKRQVRLKILLPCSCRQFHKYPLDR